MTVHHPPRIRLARLPTPLERLDRLSDAWGGPSIWVKRDDLTGFGISGNKVRKLEFHFAAAGDAGARTVITCGAAQSNHSRATAIAAARLGYRCILFLRTPDGSPPDRLVGNLLLDRLAGAEIRYITPDDYRDRDSIMEAAAADEAPAWVIPEGASDWLGMFGFVLAVEELQSQLAQIGSRPAALWHAASSAGTTAGLGWGADRLGFDVPIIGCSVGDPASEIREHVEHIWGDAVQRLGGRAPDVDWEITDDHVGNGYGEATAEELGIQAEGSALTGLIFDPTYTGKALAGLRREIERGRFGPGDDVIFWHTGGGFAAFSHDFTGVLAP